MRSDNPECDWPEDFEHENGNYICQCYKCGKTFHGHKRRVKCKICANDSESPLVTGTAEEFKSFGELCNEAFGFKVWHDIEFYTYEECARNYAERAVKALTSTQSTTIERLTKALEEIVHIKDPYTGHYKRIARQALANIKK